MVINIVCIDIISALTTISPSEEDYSTDAKEYHHGGGWLLIQNLYNFNQSLWTSFFKLYATLNSIVLKRLHPPVRYLMSFANYKTF